VNTPHRTQLIASPELLSGDSRSNVQFVDAAAFSNTDPPRGAQTDPYEQLACLRQLTASFQSARYRARII